MGYDIEKEKREAIEAGRRALNSLQTAKENLNSAKNWGLADMFGGGFFTTMLKHSKMDQAKRNRSDKERDHGADGGQQNRIKHPFAPSS